MIREFCKEKKTLKEILNYMGLKDAKSFKKLYLAKMLDEGILAMTEPDNPTSRNQMYVTQK